MRWFLRRTDAFSTGAVEVIGASGFEAGLLGGPLVRKISVPLKRCGQPVGSPPSLLTSVDGQVEQLVTVIHRLDPQMLVQ